MPIHPSRQQVHLITHSLRIEAVMEEILVRLVVRMTLNSYTAQTRSP